MASGRTRWAQCAALVAGLGMALGLGCEAGAAEVTLVIGPGTAGHNFRAVVPVELSAGESQPSTLLFDLDYDADQLTVVDVTAGDAAKAADKMVAYGISDSNRLRVMVVALNRNVLSDGVLAQVTFAPSLPGLAVPLAGTDGSAATADGDPIDVVFVNGSTAVGNLPAAGPFASLALAGALAVIGASVLRATTAKNS